MKINVRSLLSSVVIVGALFAAVASTDEGDSTPERVDDDTSGNDDANDDNGGDGDAGTGADDGQGAGGDPEKFRVGDLVQLGDWQVQVHEVTDPLESTNEFLAPEDGARWVAVDVEVTNASDEPETVSSIVCFELMDGRNRAYTMTVTADSASPPDGEVAPGASRRGTLVYEVPEDVRRLRLNFSCDLLSSGTATIVL